jgi:hydroxymethylpyrimidine pyrophosphatase-like HAD family hydrolase
MPTEGIGGQVGQFMDEITADEPEDVYEADNSALVKRAMERFKGIDKKMAQKIANAVKPKGTINSKLYVELGDLYDKKDMKGVDALLKEAFAWDELDEAENSPDGNVGADDDGNNDKYNQNANQVQDRKSIQEGDDLLDIIRNIKI